MSLKEIASIGLVVGVSLELSRRAFSQKIRREIGERDEWQCQYPGCDDGEGNPKSFKNGYMVFASHIKTHDKKHPDYNNPETGRIQCIEHEIAFHCQLLQEAIKEGNNQQITFNEIALRKLSKVDHRTYEYRNDPESFNKEEVEEKIIYLSTSEAREMLGASKKRRI